MSNKNELDQYYTEPSYAKSCMELVKPYILDRKMVEPCAGSGSFFYLMDEDNRLGMDLDPKCEGKGMVEESQDFLKYSGDGLKGSVVVSNPPFGKNSSLAIKFFNHCALLGAEVIAFVIPKTFRKDSVINKLDVNFKLVLDETTPEKSFILDGEPYNVPCCFQIWVRSEEKRQLVNTNPENPFFTFVKKGEHDFVVRRAGSRAGQLIEDEADPKVSSNYFIRSTVDKEELVVTLRSVDLTEERSNTAGVRSVTKYELARKVMEHMHER